MAAQQRGKAHTVVGLAGLQHKKARMQERGLGAHISIFFCIIQLLFQQSMLPAYKWGLSC